MKFQRRRWLKGALGAGALTGLGALLPGSPLRRHLFAAEGEEMRFVGLYLNGGWDVLLGPDARDPSRSYAGIHLGTDRLAAEWRTPIPVTIGGTPTLWGAPMRALVDAGHHDIATVFRSVNMNTVAHAAGRAYVNTFRRPAGTQARGSSLGTVLATAGPLEDGLVMPNVSIGLPTYNEHYAADYNGVRTSRATGLLPLLEPRGPNLPDEVEALLLAAQDASRGCVATHYEGGPPADQLREARRRVRALAREDVARFFDFEADTPAMQAVRSHYGFGAGASSNTPGLVAAAAAQLLHTGLTRSVTAQLQIGMDTHFGNWATEQAPRLQQAFAAVSALLSDLREDDPELRNTTVVVMSEFARTPRINGNGGRDHWFANSVLVFGGKLRRGVCGATTEEALGLQKTDLSTGLPSSDGTMLEPEHIGATIAAASGVDVGPFRTAPLTDWIEA